MFLGDGNVKFEFAHVGINAQDIMIIEKSRLVFLLWTTRWSF